MWQKVILTASNCVKSNCDKKVIDKNNCDKVIGQNVIVTKSNWTKGR